MTDQPDQTAPVDDGEGVAKPKRKAGFFTRLFGKALTGNELDVAIAPFLDAAGVDRARELAEVFKSCEGIEVRPLRDPPLLNPDVDRDEMLPSACAQAMGWVSSTKADVVIWGDIPQPGTTFFIHFASPPPTDKDAAGTISPFQALNLPVGFDVEEIGGLLLASALAAMTLTAPGKVQTCQTLIASTLERAAQDITRIPSDFTTRELASVHAAFANALSTFAHLFPGGEVYHRAADAYQESLQGTVRSENPVNWAYLQRNLGAALQALSERSDHVETLNKAAEAYEQALEVFSKELTPFPWATTQNRLGEILYRLDIKSGKTDGLKKSLRLYQSALKVLSLQSTPLLWSDTLNNLGQAAQILGRQIDNVEVTERAVDACQQALKARTREAHPALWAATQNNMGSALFLLGRMTGDEANYVQALEAFMGARAVYESMGLNRMVKLTDKNIQHAQARLPEKVSRPQANDPSMWWLAEDDDVVDPEQD
ncbi:MAG: tetratricopeptide repeat protein [Magnetovibrio sp.]|nr:tetratricopeptide repeat protein [Magnetovibrio sp.]